MSDWRTSSFCSFGSCVEVTRLADRLVAVRNSKARWAGTVYCSEEEWRAFVLGVKAGEFDFDPPTGLAGEVTEP